MNINISTIKAFIALGRGCFLRRPCPRLIVSRVVQSLGCSIGRSSSGRSSSGRSSSSRSSSGRSSLSRSSLILSSSSVSGLASIYKKGFTVVDRKLVGPLGNYTLQVSPSRAKRVYSLVYLLL